MLAACLAAGFPLAGGVLAVTGAPAALVAALAIAGSVSAAALVAVLARQLRDRDLVAGAAVAIAGGDLSARAPAAPGELASAFNEMASRLESRVIDAGTEQKRLLAALNSSTDAVVAVDQEGRVAFANSATYRLFHREERDVLGHPFAWLLADQQVVEALKASREEGRREKRIVERPGRQFYQAITTPIVEGGEWSALAVFHDISEVKRVEQVRRDFVANVSHELRTPLAALKSVVETLQSGALDDRRATEGFLDSADGEIDRLVQMVEELLELSRIESGEVPLSAGPVEIGRVVSDAVARLAPQAQKRDITLGLDVKQPLPVVAGDAGQLERVVVNLVHNALKFTPEGGLIRVSVEAADDGIAVRVEDNGAGILPEELPRIFERFYKADRSRGGSGTGLGLALAKHTIEAHGGRITVQSTPEAGSTFTFTLPAAPADAGN